MGTRSADGYVDAIPCHDDTIFDDVALHKVFSSENRPLVLHTGYCGVDDLAADFVASLRLRTTVKDLPLHCVWLWNRAFDHHEAQLLIGLQQLPRAQHLPQFHRSPTVLSHVAIDRDSFRDVNRVAVLDELLSVLEQPGIVRALRSRDGCTEYFAPDGICRRRALGFHGLNTAVVGLLRLGLELGLHVDALMAAKGQVVVLLRLVLEELEEVASHPIK